MQHDTRKTIQRKFLILLKETPIHKITVKRICDISNVNRSTFYYYYTDVYDVLSEIENDWIANFKKLLGKLDSTDLLTFFTILLEDLKTNYKLYAPVFSVNADNLFSKNFLEICFNFLIETHPEITVTKEVEWSFFYASKGSIEVIRLWLTSGCIEPVFDVAQFLASSFILRKSK